MIVAQQANSPLREVSHRQGSETVITLGVCEDEAEFAALHLPFVPLPVTVIFRGGLFPGLSGIASKMWALNPDHWGEGLGWRGDLLGCSPAVGREGEARLWGWNG